jgi:sugar lactone lactonase YvrE
MLRVLLATATAASPHVVAHLPHPVLAFAQDRTELAWVEGRTPRAKPLALVAARPDGSHRRVGTTPGGAFRGDLHVVGGRAVWQDVQARRTCIAATTQRLRAPTQIGGCAGRKAAPTAAADGNYVFRDPSTGELVRYDGSRHVLVKGEWTTDAVATAGPYVAELHVDRVGRPDTYQPSVSPDGALIAAVSRRDATSDADVYVLRSGGSVVRELKDAGDAVMPHWSPDGSLLAWVDIDGEHIVVARADGTDIRRIGGPTGGLALAWSPDGTEVDYQAAGELDAVTVDGVVRRVSALPAGVGAMTALAWSPDGKRFVAGFEPGGLWIGGGGGLVRLATDTVYGAAWSPSGDEIAYAASGAILMTRPDGSGAHRVSNPDVGDFDAAPAWTPDGKQLVFARDAGGWDLYTVAADGSQEQELTTTAPTRAVDPAQIRRVDDGGLVETLQQATSGSEIAMSRSVVAIFGRGVLSTYDVAGGRLIRSLRVDGAHFVVSGETVVYESGDAVFAVDARHGPSRLVARTHGMPIGLSVVGRRIAWAENRDGRGAILTLTLV